jgi:hypothetical protein
MSDFNTKVQGIPCVCRVTHYRPAVPGRISGPPEDCYPDEPSEFEFELLNTSGKGAPMFWLQKKVTDEDEARLQDEYEAHVTAIKHGMDF